MTINRLTLAVFCILGSLAFINNCQKPAKSKPTGKQKIVFGGGPAGGTFQVFAYAVQTYKKVKSLDSMTVKAQASAGSIENLRKVNSGAMDFGVVHAGHAYAGLHGKLKADSRKYTDVKAVSILYGSVAQLVVRKDSGIRSVKDLVGKKVGVGNAGSGAFANCELFFRHFDIWDKIERNAMGYNDAAQAFGNGQLDAFWLFTAFPSGAVLMAAQTNKISLVDLHADAQSSKFYKQYPNFSKEIIPASIYSGVDLPVQTFKDHALWVANAKVDDDVVYTLLKTIFSKDGLEHMKKQKKVFGSMSLLRGVDGIITPLHPGAKRFWKEQGLID